MVHPDGITENVRAREEEYFRKKDRELIEKMRKASVAMQARQALESETGIHDPEMLRDLEELGFTPQTISLLPLIPVLQVAWAEGCVSAAERKLIVNLARSRGIAEGSAADRQLQNWLEYRPAEATFRKAARLIAAFVDHPEAGAANVGAHELMQYCEKIAHASGGIFGLGSVSPEERAALEQIAAQLKKR